jgi:hypothetical protein
MKRHEFVANIELTNQLDMLLKNPVLMEAMDIVWKEGAPDDPNPNKGDLLHQAALSGAKAAGYFQFRANLLSLTNYQQKNKAATQSDAPQHDELAIKELMRQGLTKEQAEQARKDFIAQSTQQIS